MPHDAFPADTTRVGTPAGHGGVPGAASARRRCNPTVLTTVVAGPSGPIAVSESWAPAARTWRPTHAATPATRSAAWPGSSPRSTGMRTTGWPGARARASRGAGARRSRPRDSTQRSPGTYSRTLRVVSPSPAATAGPVGQALSGARGRPGDRRSGRGPIHSVRRSRSVSSGVPEEAEKSPRAHLDLGSCRDAPEARDAGKTRRPVGAR